MKLHRNLAQASIELCERVFKSGCVLDRELAKRLKATPQWGKRDRHFIASSVFEVVRWRRVFSFLVNSDETAQLCAAHWLQVGYLQPAWWQECYGTWPQGLATQSLRIPSQKRAIRASIPDWLDQLAHTQIGSQWDALLAALNQRAPIYLRANSHKWSREAVIDWLQANQIEAHPVKDFPDALQLAPNNRIPDRIRKAGRVEIQDLGSQMIAPLLGAQAGDTIIDSCAGVGGKTLHLANLLQNQATIIAMDVATAKLEQLKRRAQRAHFNCIQTHSIGPHSCQRYKNTADCLLMDVPCSGIGTLKRQPDLKWRLSPAGIQSVIKLQKKIIQEYPSMLKVGGRLVYATCSVLPAENQSVVQSLLATQRFELISEHSILPSESSTDGFYAALLKKRAD